MALSGGDVDSGTGLAHALFTAFEGEFGPFSSRARESLVPFCNRLGSAIVDYLKANAEVSTTIPATSAGDGLQTSTGVGTPTTAPSTPKTLQGTVQ